MGYDALVGVIIVLGLVLFAVCAVMEWIGLENVLTRSGPLRYDDCGHLRVVRASTASRCWHCRHTRLEHVLHIPAHHGH